MGGSATAQRRLPAEDRSLELTSSSSAGMAPLGGCTTTVCFGPRVGLRSGDVGFVDDGLPLLEARSERGPAEGRSVAVGPAVGIVGANGVLVHVCPLWGSDALLSGKLIIVIAEPGQRLLLSIIR